MSKHKDDWEATRIGGSLMHIITFATAAVAPLGRMGARSQGCWFLIDHFYDVDSVLLTSRCAYSKPEVEESFIAQFGPKKSEKNKQVAPMEMNIRCCSSKKLIILIYLLAYFLFIQDIMF
jgi:hypothetical protein